MVIAVIAVVFSFINLVFVLTGTDITGRATDQGYANLTVSSLTSINFTVKDINWGSGMITQGQTIATLDSEGTVGNGNWTTVSNGLVLENIGNTNVTLDLQTGKSAATFIGGTAPTYEWKVSDNEVGSCAGGAIPLSTYATVNNSAVGRACAHFGYLQLHNQVEIDINITIPEDSLKGALTDTITATATGV